MELKHKGRVLFTHNELACKGSGLLVLAPGFDEKLIEYRVELDLPIDPNSVCRSHQHNIKVRGHPRSLHVCDEPYWPTEGCCAIDIRCTNGVHRAKLITLGLKLGWCVGVHGMFVHLDRRMDYGISKEPLVFPY